MPLLGKAAGSARKFLGSDAGQAILSSLSLFVPGDPYGFVQGRRKAAEAEANRARNQQVISDLIARVQGPDAYTPQVNELIGAANARGAPLGQAPMALNAVRQAGLDFTDADTQRAVSNFLGAGGTLSNLEALNTLARGPQREPRLFNTRSGVVSVDENGNATQIYSDPYAETLSEKQAASLDAQAFQRRASGQAALTRAARPPAGRVGNGTTSAPVPTGRVY